MSSDNDSIIEVQEFNGEVPMPTAKQLAEFRKNFEQKLKWRKKYRKNQINYQILRQEARILREEQEILLMRNDLNLSAIVLDQRHYQVASVLQAAQNTDPLQEVKVEPKTTSSFKYSTNSTGQRKYGSFFENFSSDEEPQNPPKRMALQKIGTRSVDDNGSFFKATPQYSKRPQRT